MNWTTARPTVTGFYWMKQPGSPLAVVRVRVEYKEPLGYEGEVYLPGDEDYLNLFPSRLYKTAPDIDPAAAWCGPLEPPEGSRPS